MSFKTTVTIKCDLCGIEITKTCEGLRPPNVPYGTPAQWSSEYVGGQTKHGCDACMSIYREQTKEYGEKQSAFFRPHSEEWNARHAQFRAENPYPVNPLKECES